MPSSTKMIYVSHVLSSYRSTPSTALLHVTHYSLFMIYYLANLIQLQVTTSIPNLPLNQIFTGTLPIKKHRYYDINVKDVTYVHFNLANTAILYCTIIVIGQKNANFQS